MHIEAATNEDIDTLLAMLHEISGWLKNKGIAQWSNSIPRATLEKELVNGELFVVRKNPELVAAVVLSQKSGSLWESSKDSALYLNRLMVNRKFSGQELGQTVMHLSEHEALRLGLSTVRLVTDAKNFFLQTYYEKLG